MKNIKVIINTMGFIVLIGLAGAALFVGCTKEDTINTPATSVDAQAIQSIVTNADSVAEFSQSDEQIINDPEDMDWSSSNVSKTVTGIKVFKWRRQVLHIDHNVSVNISGDTLAVALLSKLVTGNLIIRASYSDTARHADTVIVKPFSEQAQRKVLFVRVSHGDNAFHNWRPVSVTLVSGSALPTTNNKFTIASVELLSPHDTFSVTNPLETWLRIGLLRNGVPHLFNNDSVRVRLTVYSDDDSSEGVAIRWAGEFKNYRDRMRLKLVSQTSGTGYAWTRVYEAGIRAHVPFAKNVGRYNVVVDVLSYGTLNDDNAVVSNTFWGLPYDVRRR